jgi:hypothetical protein
VDNAGYGNNYCIFRETHKYTLWAEQRGFFKLSFMSQQVVSKEEASLQERKCSSYGMRWGEARLLLLSDVGSTHEKVL